MSVRTVTCLALLAVMLAACGGDQEELRGWMQDQRRSARPAKEDVPPPKSFEPFRYDNAGRADPFSPAKMTLKAREPSGGRLRPDLERRREALESFTLESIRMVGHLRDRNGAVALLQAENLVYQVRVGNHAGQNHGRIIGITEDEVRLRELVQDGAGDWVERDTVLQLQVQQEKKK